MDCPQQRARQWVMRLLLTPVHAEFTHPEHELARAVADEISEAGAWPTVFQICRDWNVIPALAERVAAIDLRLTPAEAKGLGQEAGTLVFRSTLCIRAGCEAIQRLNDDGIPAVGFKGFASIAWLHSQTGARSRMVQDVDLLISDQDLPRALERLEQAGYRREAAALDLTSYIASLKSSPDSAGNLATSLTNPRGNALDLHWKLGRFDTAKLLATARQVNLLGFSVPVVCPAFGLLLSVHHALRNNFVPDRMARDVLDAADWFRLLAQSPAELSVALDYAQSWKLSAPLGAMALIVGESGGSNPCTGMDTTSPAARNLATLYARQLRSEPINADLSALGSRRAWHQVVSRAFLGWNRYLRMGTFWRRVPRLARSALSLTPMHWQELRTLAHAKDQMLD